MGVNPRQDEINGSMCAKQTGGAACLEKRLGSMAKATADGSCT
jgi:hypothetical protein